MSENIARLSKEHHAAVEHTETLLKSSSKNRFINIFKISPLKSPRSSTNSMEKSEELRPGFTKVGTNPADRARLSDESQHAPLTITDIKPQELTATTIVDRIIDATGETDAEKLVSEWQAELEETKKEGKEPQTAPTELLYARRNTIDETIEVDQNWFSYSHDEEEEHIVGEWSKCADDIIPVPKRYSYYGRKAGLDELQCSPAAEKGIFVRKKDTVDSWDKHVANVPDTSSPRTPTANGHNTGYGENEHVEKFHTVHTFLPIMEEYVTELGEVIQDTGNIQTTELDNPEMEVDNDQVDDDLRDDASANSVHPSSKLLVYTELLQQLYDQGVPTPEGVQFYVNRKITEALLAHEEKFHRPISARRLETPKSVQFGHVLITDPVLVSYSLQVVRLMYYAILFFAALAGPKSFFVWVWKMAVIFGVYEIVTRELGWKNEQTPDLLFEPLHHGVEELLGKGEDAAMCLGYTLGPFITGIVRGIVDGDDAEVEE
jgi:hypothetical protein